MSENTIIDKKDLISRINNLRSEFNNENKKGLFSTKQYKFDCANSILKKFDLNTLLTSMLTILPNSHHIFFDYTIFKTFATPELCDTLVNYTISNISQCLNNYGTYEMHINLQGFTVTAFYRYKDIIEAYTNKLNIDHPEFHDNVKAMHIYYVPSTIETISQLMSPMFNNSVKEKVIYYNKETSKKPFQTIMEILQITNENCQENSP